MPSRIFEALRVGTAAVVGSGVATVGTVQDGRVPLSEFVGHLLAVLVLTAIAWLAFLSLRTGAN